MKLNKKDKENNNKEEMIKVKCSVCNKNMDMPASFLEKDENAENIPHICSNCIGNIGEFLGDKKIQNFADEINAQMEKLGENNGIAEKLAKEITDNNINSLLDELKGTDAPIEQKLTESFFRGAWMALFLIANNNEKGFLEKEAKKIRDFHENMHKRGEE